MFTRTDMNPTPTPSDFENVDFENVNQFLLTLSGKQTPHRIVILHSREQCPKWSTWLEEQLVCSRAYLVMGLDEVRLRRAVL